MATTAPKAANTRGPDTAPAAEPIAPKKKSKVLLLVLVMVLLGGIGAAAWYFWPGHEDPAAPNKSAAGKAAVAKVASSKPRTYVPLEPFTVNLQREDSQSSAMLQTGLSLKLTDETLAVPIKLQMTEIRSRILLLLTGKTASELATPEGKKKLAEELAREVVQALPAGTAATGLEAVLFTSFLIQ
jgi:flagellar FliL protein